MRSPFQPQEGYDRGLEAEVVADLSLLLLEGVLPLSSCLGSEQLEASGHVKQRHAGHQF